MPLASVGSPRTGAPSRRTRETADLDTILSVSELSALVQVPVPTIYKWRATGRGPRALRVGKHLRFRMSDVDAWLESCADELA